MIRAALLLAVLAGPALAQDVAEASGARLRLLDKLTGAVTDLTLAAGESATVARLTVRVDECRYPADNATADAFAHLTIRDQAADAPVFSGWMVASSPALSALDHPRYDVWVLRCLTPDQPQLDVVPEPPSTEEEFEAPLAQLEQEGDAFPRHQHGPDLDPSQVRQPAEQPAPGVRCLCPSDNHRRGARGLGLLWLDGCIVPGAVSAGTSAL